MSTSTSDAVAPVHGVWSYKDLEPEQVRWYWNKTPLSLKGQAKCLVNSFIFFALSQTENERRSGLCSYIPAGYLPPSTHVALL